MLDEVEKRCTKPPICRPCESRCVVAEYPSPLLTPTQFNESLDLGIGCVLNGAGMISQES